MRERLARYLLLYAVFLLVCGVVAYFAAAKHASTAILGGIAGGILIAILSALFRRGSVWATPALKTALGVFTLTFAWRAVGAWQLSLAGDSERTNIALLLSVMFVVSSMFLFLLLRRQH